MRGSPACAPPRSSATSTTRPSSVAECVRAADDELLGYVFLYSLDVPASIAALLLRGDPAMHERMAALVQPGQRSAAVLFRRPEGLGVALTEASEEYRVLRGASRFRAYID